MPNMVQLKEKRQEQKIKALLDSMDKLATPIVMRVVTNFDRMDQKYCN